MGSNDLIRVAPESGPSDFFEARLASLRVPVRVEYSAIRDLRAGFEGDGERIGLLLGSSSPLAVSIQHCELLALSPATLGDPKSLQGALHQFIRARLHTPLEDAPELLGYFRTQNAGWPEMRDADFAIAKRSFPGQGPLFVLIQTTQHRPWLAGIYALDAKAAKPPSEPSLEFPFDEYLLRNGYLTALVEAPELASVELRPIQTQPNKSRWIIAAGLSVILLGASAAAYNWYHQAGRAEVAGPNAAASTALSLKVARSGKDFEISWDRLSAAVQQASGGTLTINDGALTRSVALNGAQLREGQILYTPLFEELTFRLEVGAPGQATAESVQVLAWSGKQPGETLTVPPPSPATNTNSIDSLPRAFGGAAALPPASISPAKPGGPPPGNSKKDLGAIAPTSAPKSAPVTTGDGGKQSRTVAVVQPSSSNSVPKQDIVPATPARVPNTSPPAVTAEKPPVAQPAAQPAPNTSLSQPAAPAPKPVAPAPKPVAPAPKPEAPPPVTQTVPAASAQPVAPPTVAAASSTSPTPVAVVRTAPGNIVLPVPVQRAAPFLPRNIPAGTTAGSPRSVSIRVMVDSSGSVQNAEVISSTPKGAFGEAVVKTAALDAARKWTFRPGQLNGKNVAAEYTIDFKFQ
ncbi:MAG: TonB family protein [Limisphaerales bacterium]